MNVFVSVGTQLPFERLISYVESVFLGTEHNVFIQTAGVERKEDKNICYKNYLSPNEYNKYINWCDIMISHAGMGTIITSLEENKPLIIVPRLASLGEHRNEHQLATSKKFEDSAVIKVAKSKEELEAHIKKEISVSRIESSILISEELLNFLKLSI